MSTIPSQRSFSQEGTGPSSVALESPIPPANMPDLAEPGMFGILSSALRGRQIAGPRSGCHLMSPLLVLHLDIVVL